MSTDTTTLSRDRFTDWINIGFGIHGTVYSAYDTFLQQRVAIKEVGNVHKIDGVSIRSGKYEILALKSLQCECVVKYYGYWEELNRQNSQCPPRYLIDYTYIVEELVEGELLKSLVERWTGRLEGADPKVKCVNINIEYQKLVWKILGQIIEAMVIFQERGWVHQDLNLNNIFWIGSKSESSCENDENANNDGKIRIIDFSLSGKLSEGYPPDNITQITCNLTGLDFMLYSSRGKNGRETYDIRLEEYKEDGIILSPIMKDMLLLMIMSLKDHRGDSVGLLRLYQELDTQ